MGSMSTPPEDAVQVLDESEQLYCYGHPKTATKLRCSRCERPICGRCAIPASVGQHCPECVAEARRKTPKVRSAIRATAPAVMVLIAITVLAYLLQVPLGLTREYGSLPPAIADGEWWRLVTAMFLHSPAIIFHILFNMYVLYIYGPNVEEAFGTLRFVTMYLLSGFFASAVSYALGPCNVLGVGASGAIFGIAGVLLVYLYNRRSSTFIQTYLRNIVFFIGINLVFGFILPNIDNFAHMGGLAAGVALGAGFDYGRRSPAALQLVTALAVGGGGVLLVMWRTATFVCGV